MRPLLLSIAVLTGCASAPSEPLVIRIAMWGPLGKFNPTVSEAALAAIGEPLVFEKVATVDDRGETRPVLATAIRRTANGALRIELRGDAKFSDGSQVTSGDVMQALELQGLRVTRDGDALIAESARRGVPAEALLVRATVFKRSGSKFLGSGPFVLASETDAELRFVRREPRNDRVGEVRIIAYSTPKDAFAHTLKGDANAVIDLEPRWLEFFRDVPRLRIVRGAGHGVEAVVFNGSFSREERVRLAKVLSSTRVRELAYGKGECAEGEGGSSEELPRGRPFRVLSWGPMERLGLAARRALGARGGEAINASPAEVLAALKARDFDLVTLRPVSWPASSIGIVWRTGSPDNVAAYSNPNFDRAIEAGEWAAAQEALRDDPPAAFVCRRASLAVVDARVRDAKLGPLDLLESLPGWEVAP